MSHKGLSLILVLFLLPHFGLSSEDVLLKEKKQTLKVVKNNFKALITRKPKIDFKIIADKLEKVKVNSATSFNKKAIQKTTPKIQLKIKNQMHSIASHLKSLKDIKEWINKAPKEDRLYRRQHFSQYMSIKIPEIEYTQNKIFLYLSGREEEPHIFWAKEDQGGVKYFYDNKDVTRKRNEKIEAWHKRINSTTTTLIHFFISKAHAAPSSYWAAIMGSMQTRQEWADKDINRILLGDAELMRSRQDLKCNRGIASFNQNIAGRLFGVVTNQESEVNGLHNFVLQSKNSSQSIPQLEINYNANNTGFNLRTIAQPNTVHTGANFMPQLAGYMNQSTDSISSPPQGVEDEIFKGMIHNSTAYKVCNLLKNNSIDSCDSEVDPLKFLGCVDKSILQAKLPHHLSFGNPLNSLGREGGVQLKIELAHLLAPGDFNVTASGRPFPQNQIQNQIMDVRSIPTLMPGVSREQILDNIQKSLNVNDEIEGSLAGCIESLRQENSARASCHDYVNKFEGNDLILQGKSITGLIQAINNISRTDQARSTSPLNEREQINSTQVSDEGCLNRFNGPEQRASLNHYATLEELSIRERSLANDLELTVSAADTARACCLNNQCVSFLNQTLSTEKIQEIRASR